MIENLSRRGMLRGTGLAALGLAIGGSAAACSSVPAAGSSGGTQADLLVTAKKQGFLRVGIANEPPYTQVQSDGTVTGCEPDVLRAVCQRMGIKDIQGIVTPYDSMIPGLNANRWDVIAAGLFMKQSRCAQVLYTEPVIVSTESFATPKGNPKGLSTIAGIVANKSLRIAVLPGGFEEGILKSANVPDSQQVKVADGRSGAEALKAGRADAFLLPTLSLKALAKTDSSFDVTPPVNDAPRTGSGAAFRKTDAAFHAAYNTELAAFKKTTGFSDILTKWGFDPAAVVGVTTAELCKNAG